MIVKRMCAQCGREFERPDRRKAVTCSRECRMTRKVAQTKASIARIKATDPDHLREIHRRSCRKYYHEHREAILAAVRSRRARP